MPGDNVDLQDDLALVLEAAQAAGELALWWQAKGARVWDKAPGSPVTEADIAVNDLIQGKLAKARPDYGWLSEESPAQAGAPGEPSTFVVDPIDGTRAFIEGKPGFCISIARTDRDVPVLGVLFNPATQELFYACRSGGAWLNGKPITCSGPCDPESARLIARPEGLKRAIQAQLPGAVAMDRVPSSIAYRVGLVAAGQWDGVISSGPKADWDLAAAIVILEEAGGIATGLAGERLEFGRQGAAHNGLAGAGETLHPLLMDSLRAVSLPFRKP